METYLPLEEPFAWFQTVKGSWCSQREDLYSPLTTNMHQNIIERVLENCKKLFTMFYWNILEKHTSQKSNQFMSYWALSHIAALTLLPRCIRSPFITLIQCVHPAWGMGFRSCWFAFSMQNCDFALTTVLRVSKSQRDGHPQKDSWGFCYLCTFRLSSRSATLVKIK